MSGMVTMGTREAKISCYGKSQR